MMKRPLVTIIIPAYNVEQYIGRMLKCCIQQTYQNLEILVVNDGSVDKTKEIIKQFARTDSRIELIDIPNGGVSNARNVALAKTHGEKVFFWDADDIVSPLIVETCIEVADKYNVKSVFYGYSENGKPGLSSNVQPVFPLIISGGGIVEKVLPKYIGISFYDINRWAAKGGSLRDNKESSACWHTMFDVSTIQNNNIRFNKNLSLGEDTIFLNTYLIYEKSICHIDNVFYDYIERKDGANQSHLHDVRKRINDKIKLIDARKELDTLSRRIRNKGIDKFSKGTNVLSIIEIAVRLSLDSSLTTKDKHDLFKQFISHPIVGKSLEQLILPNSTTRTIPLRILKLRNGWLLFWLIQLVPQRFLKKIII